MKKNLCILVSVAFTALFLTFTANAQTVRRVNKTPGLNDPAIYISVQAAHDASAAGDIIYVEPTDVDNGSYDPIGSGSTTTINRPITIIGTGYDLSTTPNTSFDKRKVSLTTLVFENGSIGSKVMGMTFTNSVSIRDEQITVTRCSFFGSLSIAKATQLLGGVYSNGNNAIISNNRLTTVRGDGVVGGQAVNCIITNNIFNGNSAYISNFIGGVINYNTIYANSSFILTNVDGSTFTNNIIDARDRTVGYQSVDGFSNGTTVSNNLCTNVAGLPVGGGNVNSTNPNLVFTTANPWTASPYIDNNLQLAVSSPAKTVGPGGTPIGAFAGNNPYVLSGVPNVPVITTFFNTGAGTTATPLNVTISVRSAN